MVYHCRSRVAVPEELLQADKNRTKERDAQHMHPHMPPTTITELYFPFKVPFSFSFFFFLIPSPFNPSTLYFHNYYNHHQPLCFFSSTMSSSHKLWLSPLRNWVTNSLHQLKALMSKIKRRKPKKRLLTSGFDWITSSFAAMEVSNQLRQVFNLIDANGDGKISSLELGDVLLCLGHEKSTAAKEAEGMVREADCNGDGFIDLDEFMDVVGSNTSADDDLRDAFLVFDSDRNGFISAKELKKVLISLGHYKCTLHECSSMIRGVDKDGDGVVNFEEFRSMMTAG